MYVAIGSDTLVVSARVLRGCGNSGSEPRVGEGDGLLLQPTSLTHVNRNFPLSDLSTK